MFLFLGKVTMASEAGSLSVLWRSFQLLPAELLTSACLMDWLKWLPCWGITVWDYMNSPSDPGRDPAGLAVTTIQKKKKKIWISLHVKDKCNFMVPPPSRPRRFSTKIKAVYFRVVTHLPVTGKRFDVLLRPIRNDSLNCCIVLWELHSSARQLSGPHVATTRGAPVCERVWKARENLISCLDPSSPKKTCNCQHWKWPGGGGVETHGEPQTYGSTWG